MSRNVTYLRVSFVLQVEHEKQLTHQALFRADTTEGRNIGNEHSTFDINYRPSAECGFYYVDTHHRLQSHGCSDSTRRQRA